MPKWNAARHGWVVASCVLVAGVFAVFGQAAAFGFVTWDDPRYVTHNPAVAGGLGWGAVRAAFTFQTMPNWHPLALLSHALDVELFGLAPAGHHMVNVALHAANTVLLLFLVRRLGGDLPRSLLVAALFALHPLHVEPVAWIAARKDLLSTLFLLIALSCYVRFAMSGRWADYALSLAAFVLACLAKSMVVTAPVLMLLLDLWVVQRRIAAGLLIEKLPFLAAGLAVAIANSYGHATWNAVVGLDAAPLLHRLASVPANYAGYLWRTLWPSGLAFMYPDADAFTGLGIAAGVLLVGGLTPLALAARHERPMVAFGWCWFLVAFLPVIGLFRVGGTTFHDRFTYVPLIGLFLAVAWLLPLGRRVARAGALAACLAYAAAAFVQTGTWRDDATLFGHALALDPANPLAHANMAARALAERRLDPAAEHAEAALRLRPDMADAMVILGGVTLARGRPAEALQHYERAARTEPNAPAAWSGLGAALSALGDDGRALRALAQAQRIRPDDPQTLDHLVTVLVRMGRLDEALPAARAAVAVEPNYRPARLRLAGILDRLGRAEEAAAERRAAEPPPSRR